MLAITLLGKPRLARDGEPIESPRGNKSWAVLARLVRSQDPVSRQTLVDELFGEADDPMAALRWTLAELRRRTGLPAAFAGNPLNSDLGSGVSIDVDNIADGAFDKAPAAGRFLEGIEIRDSATFETWLLVERQRVEGEVLGALRQRVLRALSTRDYALAITFASSMVQRDPLDEGAHILLVKAYASAGDASAASAQLEATRALFLRELGVEPSPALRAAARAPLLERPAGVSPRVQAESLRSAGLAALSAGAGSAGIECLRGAAAAAELAKDPALLSECLLELGAGLVHGVRGFDDEGQVFLESALEASREAGDKAVAARSLAELGYVDVLFGRRLSGTQRLASAREVATGNPGLMAIVSSYEGMNLHDWGRLDESVECFRESIELSRESGKVRRESWALGVGARSLYGRGDFAEGGAWASRSTEISFEERWPAFRPWAESWRALIDLAEGQDPSKVRITLEGTFALSCQLQDTCWEGISAKALSMTYAAEGHYDRASDWLRTAADACRRNTDCYKWVAMDILMTEAEIARDRGDAATAREFSHAAISEAANFGMDGLLERANAVAKAG